MSAGTHAYVSCDGKDVRPDGKVRYCARRIEVGTTKAEARREARRQGWLVAVSLDGTKWPGINLWDFCGAHRPDRKTSGEQPEGSAA